MEEKKERYLRCEVGKHLTLLRGDLFERVMPTTVRCTDTAGFLGEYSFTFFITLISSGRKDTFLVSQRIVDLDSRLLTATAR